MSPVETLIAMLVGIGTLLSMLGMAIRWMVKHYLEEIKHELKPNGGGSIKDQVNRLEMRQDKSDTLRKETYIKVEKLEKKIEDLYDKFIEYLSNR
jgi:hypothetical protein